MDSLSLGAMLNRTTLKPSHRGHLYGRENKSKKKHNAVNISDH
jgi:hypothetical protein